MLAATRLRRVSPRRLISHVRGVGSFSRGVLCCNPRGPRTILSVVGRCRGIPRRLRPIPTTVRFDRRRAPRGEILLTRCSTGRVCFSTISGQNRGFSPTVRPALGVCGRCFNNNVGTVMFRRVHRSHKLTCSTKTFLVAPSGLGCPCICHAFVTARGSGVVSTVGTFSRVVGGVPRSRGTFGLTGSTLVAHLHARHVAGSSIL